MSGSAKVLVGRDGPLAELHQCLLKQYLRSRHLCHEVALAPLSEAHVVDYLVGEQADSALPDGPAELIKRSPHSGIGLPSEVLSLLGED